MQLTSRFTQIKQLALTGLVLAALGGCATSIPLESPPVEDRTGTSVSPLANANAGKDAQGNAAANNRLVQSVDLSKSTQDKMGPAGERIVYFDYDSFAVRSEFQPLLENQARFLKADKGRKAVIEGHTDERGGREYNLALGQKRAEAVRRSLGLLGVVDAQVEAVSFGKEKPADLGHDETAMAKNRRAEVAYR